MRQFGTYEKDGETRTARDKDHANWLQWGGWQEIDPADAVEATDPETVTVDDDGK